MSDSATPWTVAHWAPLSMEFSRQEYWSEEPFLSPGDLPNPGIKPWSPALQADSLPSELQEQSKMSVSIYISKVACHQFSVIHLLVNSFVCPTHRTDKQVGTGLGTEKGILQETRKNRQLMLKRPKIPNWWFSGNILDFFFNIYLCGCTGLSCACGIFSCNSSIHFF